MSMKIALLEDDLTNSGYIQTLLEMKGYQVIPHSYGRSLLAALQTIGDLSSYDVLIIDLWLPESLSGQEVMHHLQREYPTRHLPFIVVSASSLPELDCVQADFPETPIIRKPFRGRQLLEAIQWVVARPKTPAATSLDA